MIIAPFSIYEYTHTHTHTQTSLYGLGLCLFQLKKFQPSFRLKIKHFSQQTFLENSLISAILFDCPKFVRHFPESVTSQKINCDQSIISVYFCILLQYLSQVAGFSVLTAITKKFYSAKICYWLDFL
jgi:hypothetical protein